MPEPEKTLTINEIYHSIQGESTWVGRPCVFVRMTFCDLRCNYCDTEYAFYEGKKQTLKQIVDAVSAFRCPLVEITGGEPLLQKNVLPLMSILCDTGYTVLLETSGAHDISKVDPRVHRIMDLKTPGSGELDKNLWSNIDHLTLRDEVKFVMGSREDYEWSRDKVQQHDLSSAVTPCYSRRFSAGSTRGRSLNGFWLITLMSFSTSDAQIHLEPDAARSLIDTRAPIFVGRLGDLSLVRDDTGVRLVILCAMRARLTKDFTFEAAQLCQTRQPATNAAACMATASKLKFQWKAKSIRKSAGFTITQRSATR